MKPSASTVRARTRTSKNSGSFEAELDAFHRRLERLGRQYWPDVLDASVRLDVLHSLSHEAACAQGTELVPLRKAVELVASTLGLRVSWGVDNAPTFTRAIQIKLVA